MKKIIILVLAIIVLVSGCFIFFDFDEVEGLVEFENNFMGSYKMMIDTATTKAIAPVWNMTATFGTEYTVNDYPEVGQITSWVYSDQSNNIWNVVSTTTYPNDDLIDHTTESYRILDNAPIGTHGNEDTYIDANDVEDTKYRSEYSTSFADNTSRRERIVYDGTDAEGRFELFDIDGTLDYDSIVIPNQDITLDEMYSEGKWGSVVEYSHNLKENYDWLWWGSVAKMSVNGTRYYSQETVEGVVVQTFIFKEYGKAQKTEWDEVIVSGLPDDKRSTFEGILRIEISGTTKTIKGRYVINSRNGRHIATIDNEIITVE